MCNVDGQTVAYWRQDDTDGDIALVARRLVLDDGEGVILCLKADLQSLFVIAVTGDVYVQFSISIRFTP